MAPAAKQARHPMRKRANLAQRNGVVIRIMSNLEQFELPTWVVDHKSLRRWATSDELPEHGRFSYLDGELWVDLSMERWNHNQVKMHIGAVLALLVQALGSGYYMADGMLITNVAAGLSTEPDGGFVSHESLRRKRARLRKGDESVELVGRPDMVLEVVSPTSVDKDTEILPELYWRAGVQEYWLVDPRGEQVAFDILQHGPKGYAPIRKRGGWIKSEVFGKSFRLTQSVGADGLTDYHLEVR